MRTLTIVAHGERELVMTRAFQAPRRLVWDAYTKPALLTRWLGVFDGWTFAVCEVDLRVGGAYRWVWRHPEHGELAMGGVYTELAPPERLVATERFDQSWYPGGAVNTTRFLEEGGTTTLHMTCRYDSKEARDAVLRSPMESGMGAGLDNLERLLPTLA